MSRTFTNTGNTDGRSAVVPHARALSDFLAQIPQYVLLLVLLAILAALMLYPVLSETASAFTDKGRLSPVWIETALQNRTFLGQLSTSLALAVTVTILANLIAFPLALIAGRYSFRGKGLLAALVLLPMVLPPFVGAIGMKQILGTFGSLTVFLQHLHILGPHQGIDWLGRGGFWALAALITLGVYPIAYLNLQASLANIDPAMLEAAENMGGRRWRNFWRITLPLAMPGVFGGSTIIFIWAFTELGTPLLLGYQHVVSISIWDDLTAAMTSDNSVAFAKVVVVLTISVLVFAVGKLIFGRMNYATAGKAQLAATTRRLGGWRAILAATPFAAVIVLASLPHIGVVLYSFTAIAVEKAHGWGIDGQFGWYRSVIPSRYTLAGYRAVFNVPDIYQSIINSVKYAGIATGIDVVLGIAIAWVLVRTRVIGRTALDALAMLPLAVPGLVMAFGFIAVLRAHHLQPFDGSAQGILDTAPIWILVLAYAIRRMPYLVRSATGGLQQTSVTLEEAAANLGAGPLRVLWKITLPLIMANLIAGSLLTFAFSMLEVSDSLILAKYPQHFPITKMIYTLGNDTSGPENVRNACALGVLAMGLLAATMISAALLMGKKLGAVFRA